MVEKKKSSGSPEPVWTFRGYELKASEFNAAMIHFFRAEINRANVWRQRLDTTTNWAVITTGAVISFAFSQPQASHIVILLDLLLVTLFLLIEARRDRYYELWSYRVRLMETDFFAAMLVPPFHPSAEWSEALAETLLHPQFPISASEALGRRLRRNYLWIYAIILISWLAKVWLLPQPALNWQEFSARASIGPIEGQWILILIGAITVATLMFALLTSSLQNSPGEVLPRFGLGEIFLGRFGKTRQGVEAWFRPTRRRQQLLAMVVTALPEEVTKRILDEMRRGATVLSGKGAFSGEDRSVLMVALTVTETAHLKSIVAEVDENAFVVLSPVQGVFGRGFSPLGEK